jgi:hypothetical protein
MKHPDPFQDLPLWLLFSALNLEHSAWLAPLDICRVSHHPSIRPSLVLSFLKGRSTDLAVLPSAGLLLCIFLMRLSRLIRHSLNGNIFYQLDLPIGPPHSRVRRDWSVLPGDTTTADVVRPLA